MECLVHYCETQQCQCTIAEAIPRQFIPTKALLYLANEEDGTAEEVTKGCRNAELTHCCRKLLPGIIDTHADVLGMRGSGASLRVEMVQMWYDYQDVAI